MPAPTAEQVEQGVTVVIEDALASIVGIEQLRSFSAEGVAKVVAEVDADFDFDAVQKAIENAVAGVDLAEEVSTPSVSPSVWQRQVINVAVIW